MPDDPIKLFATRAEKFPQSNDSDATRAALEKIVEQIPVFGPATIHVISQFLVPGVERRRESWFKDLADAVDRLKERVDGFDVGNLAQNEDFISATIQATRIAIGTHQQQKLEALRNAVLNIALGRSLDEEKQRVFLGLVDIFTVTHLEILRLFANPAVYPSNRRAELRERRQLTDPMVIDLNDRGMLVDPRPYVARTRESPESLTLLGWTLSPLGKEFLSFIAPPEQMR